MADLIDLDTARQRIPTAGDTDEPVIAGLISAASKAAQRYCRRYFVLTDYDELYNGNGDRRLILRNYPLTKVSSVRYRPVTVLKIQNNLANTPQARVSVTATGLTLVRVTSGVTTTDTSITFAGSATILAVQNAVNALGSGWSAQGAGYDAWPSADLYCPQGVVGSDGPQPNAQGALTAAGQYAELKMHTYELAGYQLDARRGWLLRALPYTDPELLQPEDLVWPVGINNFRVQYTAGYATVPDDVQEACAELVATWFVQRGRDLNLQSERVQGAFQYTVNPNADQLPPRVRQLLRPYRYHRVANDSA